MSSRHASLLATAAPALVVLSLLAAGCGGARAPQVAGSSGTTTIEYGTPGAAAAAVAFARCMRSHGVPDWPDPQSDGSFDKRKLVQLGVDPARIRTIEGTYCPVDFESRGSTQTITAADRRDYLAAAACMRRHGYPSFPDPTFPANGVRVAIPASIDQSSVRFRNAATTCTKLIPPGLPYTRPRGQ